MFHFVQPQMKLRLLPRFIQTLNVLNAETNFFVCMRLFQMMRRHFHQHVTAESRVMGKSWYGQLSLRSNTGTYTLSHVQVTTLENRQQGQDVFDNSNITTVKSVFFFFSLSDFLICRTVAITLVYSPSSRCNLRHSSTSLWCSLCHVKQAILINGGIKSGVCDSCPSVTQLISYSFILLSSCTGYSNIFCQALMFAEQWTICLHYFSVKVGSAFVVVKART